MTDIDFGIQIEPQFGYTYPHIRDVARSAEKYGMESLWTSDHLLIRPEAVDINCLECWTTLSALSRETKILRLGNMVASQSYRNPALHAKIASSLDHISSGRIYFGIGAGWKEVEYDAYNIPFPKPWVRVKQLDESIEIAKRMWYESVADYHGRYYNINKTVSMPKPIQNPLPIVIGGMGYHLLKVTAKHADMANFAWDIPLARYREKLDVLKKHCNRYNRDFETIRKCAGIYLGLQGAEAKEMAPYEKYSGKRKWEYWTPEEAAEFIKEYVELGVDHFVIVFPFGVESESIKILMENVVSNI
jgi:alkanesulfonate monooxygenase SsuD/methylene tetrahydromethanopterin reductase-like flavin-dependent oxidoreductase (luciferase family)